jgi:hypothetical protein
VETSKERLKEVSGFKRSFERDQGGDNKTSVTASAASSIGFAK